MNLKFEYCECGCHGHGASVGSLGDYWLYNDLKGGYYLHSGHGSMSPRIGKYTSFNAAKQAAVEDVKKRLEEVARALAG